MGLLDGKVVLVTGGGRGIGRETALIAARQGAKVVVNDLGAGVHGEGADKGPAQEVADIIKAAGGEAVANTESVTDLRAVGHMVQQAMDTFGGLHVVSNPAGILRDRMVHNMTEEEWDAIMTVHLRGHFNVVRATVNHFRTQQDGCYVMWSRRARASWVTSARPTMARPRWASPPSRGSWPWKARATTSAPTPSRPAPRPG